MGMKIRTDKDPFTALTQMLACAVHVATPHQYRRLCDFVPAGKFPTANQPRLDGYVLLYRFLETPQPDLEGLDNKAKELSSILLLRSEIASAGSR